MPVFILNSTLSTLFASSTPTGSPTGLPSIIGYLLSLAALPIKLVIRFSLCLGAELTLGQGSRIEPRTLDRLAPPDFCWVMELLLSVTVRQEDPADYFCLGPTNSSKASVGIKILVCVCLKGVLISFKCV